MTIHKYPFEIAGSVMIEMPRGAVILSCQVQRGVPCFWAMVDPDEPTMPVMFRIFGTGHPIHPGEAKTLAFVGTIQMGSYVWHVFRLGG